MYVCMYQDAYEADYAKHSNNDNDADVGIRTPLSGTYHGQILQRGVIQRGCTVVIPNDVVSELQRVQNHDFQGVGNSAFSTMQPLGPMAYTKHNASHCLQSLHMFMYLMLIGPILINS